MKAMIVETPNEGFVQTERDVPEPGAGEVRIRVHACGICHSDHFVAAALWPGLELPRAPGHEVAGVVDAVGPGVARLASGDRVGLGWHGGHDGTCDNCLSGRYLDCRNAKIAGISYDGGYQEYVVAPEVALARIPDGMEMTDAAPLMCAGITTFNALRNAGARPGDLVAIQGLGGLGHLGVQYARAMGLEVAAISRGAKKGELARTLGAHHYIDTEQAPAAEQLTALGGAKVILATAPNAPAISALTAGLALEGALIVVGAPFEPIQVNALELIPGNRRIQGWSSGTATDSADAMEFAAKNGVKPMIELFPLTEAQAAYDRMMSGEVRFRSVLQIA